MKPEEFEWDDDKATENLRAHGITFDTAVGAFRDPFAVQWLDEREAYGEERCNLLGMCEGVILHVTYRDPACNLYGAGRVHPNHLGPTAGQT